MASLLPSHMELPKISMLFTQLADNYNRQVQYRVTSITQPEANSYFWEGFMLKDPNVIMTGHLWQNEGVWMYTENQRFTDGRPPENGDPSSCMSQYL